MKPILHFPDRLYWANSGVQLKYEGEQEPEIQSVFSVEIPTGVCGNVTWTWVAKFSHVTQSYTF